MAWTHRSPRCSGLHRTRTSKTGRAPRHRRPRASGFTNLPFAIVGGVYDFRERRTVDDIVEIVRQVEATTGENVVLMCIDTLSRALCGGDENSSKDIGALVGATARLQDITNAHIMWVHHMPHEGERMRGHGALLGALDTTIHVVKMPDGLRTATVIKANDSEEGERIAFALDSVSVGNDTTAPVVVSAETAARVQADGPKLTKKQQTMFSILPWGRAVRPNHRTLE